MSSTRSRTDELEAVAYEFWRAPEVEELDGWRLRFGYGITGRANSVWPNGDGTLPLDEKIDRAEAWYRERGLATLFQLTAAARPAGLDDALAARVRAARRAGLRRDASLDDVLARTSGDAELTQHADDAWLELWAGSRGFADLAAARELLSSATRRSRAIAAPPSGAASSTANGSGSRRWSRCRRRAGAATRERSSTRSRAGRSDRGCTHATAPGREHERAGARAVRERQASCRTTQYHYRKLA